MTGRKKIHYGVISLKLKKNTTNMLKQDVKNIIQYRKIGS